MQSNAGKDHLRIGEAAALLKISPSLLRSWESQGLVRPARSNSKYRLYDREDIQVLRKAVFLRRVRGLNVPAIRDVFTRQGRLRANDRGQASIGSRLRALRLRRGDSLKMVANAVGISTGFLSSLERSQMSASVSTLSRLAQYYKTNILEFFDVAESGPRHVCRTERKNLDVGPGVRMELLAWGSTVMEPHLFRIGPGCGSGDAYSHEGEEFLYILKGRLDIAVEDEEYHLRRGDSFYFVSRSEHSWANRGTEEALVLWINTPPTF